MIGINYGVLLINLQSIKLRNIRLAFNICIWHLHLESDMWQQLELASELESDLQDTVDLGKKWLVDFNARKTQLVSFDWSNNNGSIDMKMDGSVLEEKSSLRCWG